MNTLLLLLSALPAFAADCVNIVPAKSLGVLFIGQLPPTEKVGDHAIQRDKESPAWLSAGPYFFHTDKNGKIDSIQYDPGGIAVCYSLKGRKLPSQPNFRALKKSLRSCKEEEVFGGWRLGCDGVMWLEGHPGKSIDTTYYRVIVENKTQREREVERAGEHVKGLIQEEWPYRAKKK